MADLDRAGANGQPGASKSDRLNVRIQPESKHLLEHAATLLGRSLSDFVVQSAIQEARRTIDTHQRVALSQQQSRAFAAALLDPPEPTDKAVQAARRYKKRAADR